MMKDPNEHVEHEDVKRDCLKYKNAYGKHFTKELCEMAVSKLENANGSDKHFSVEEVMNLWHKHNLPDIPHANWYDVTYVMNMGYADYYGKLFTNTYEVGMFTYLYLSDPDGYEGIAFERWVADMKNKDIDIDWHSYIHI